MAAALDDPEQEMPDNERIPELPQRERIGMPKGDKRRDRGIREVTIVVIYITFWSEIAILSPLLLTRRSCGDDALLLRFPLPPPSDPQRSLAFVESRSRRRGGLPERLYPGHRANK